MNTNIKTAIATAFSGLTLMASVAVADIVHNDDVIITFSLCTGNDCVDGENFGFDTLRLKENNLRIHFDDTSASASFPANDWRILANDTINGGTSHFSVEDSTAVTVPFRIEAGAGNNALVIDSTNSRIGMGTVDPAVLMHAVDGNTPTLRLEQDGTSGFAAQTWDMAGNEAGFFVRDVTNGSKLPFRIRPGASTSSLDIQSDGRVGIGTASPDANTKLTVKGGSAAKGIAVDGQVQIEGSGVARLVFLSPDGSHKYNFTLDNGGNLGISRGGSGVMELTLSGNGNVVVGGNLVVQGTCTGCN